MESMCFFLRCQYVRRLVANPIAQRYLTHINRNIRNPIIELYPKINHYPFGLSGVRPCFWCDLLTQPITVNSYKDPIEKIKKIPIHHLDSTGLFWFQHIPHTYPVSQGTQ